MLAFGYWLGGGERATVFGSDEPRFVQRQLSPPRCLSPQRDQSRIPEVHPGEVTATSALAPKISLLGLSPKKVDDIVKATGYWKGLRIPVKLTHSEETGPE